MRDQLFLCLVAVWCLASQSASAQVIGEEAELQRLHSKADEAIANGDADGAAMNSGKAALMAAVLAKRQQDPAELRLYQGAEMLFRGQEHAYRALALFQRAGGQPPASSGTCSTMTLAGNAVAQSLSLLRPDAPAPQDLGKAREMERLRTVATDWVKTVEGMRDDFRCP